MKLKTVKISTTVDQSAGIRATSNRSFQPIMTIAGRAIQNGKSIPHRA